MRHFQNKGAIREISLTLQPHVASCSPETYLGTVLKQVDSASFRLCSVDRDIMGGRFLQLAIINIDQVNRQTCLLLLNVTS